MTQRVPRTAKKIAKELTKGMGELTYLPNFPYAISFDGGWAVVSTDGNAESSTRDFLVEGKVNFLPGVQVPREALAKLCSNYQWVVTNPDDSFVCSSEMKLREQMDRVSLVTSFKLEYLRDGYKYQIRLKTPA